MMKNYRQSKDGYAKISINPTALGQKAVGDPFNLL